jgi:hypothetical protein
MKEPEAGATGHANTTDVSHIPPGRPAAKVGATATFGDDLNRIRRAVIAGTRLVIVSLQCAGSLARFRSTARSPPG